MVDQFHSGVLNDLIECISDGVVAADLDGRMLLFNTAAQRLLGLGARDVPGSEWSDTYRCFREDATTPFPADELPLARALRGEPVFNVLVHIKNPQVPGGTWISVNGSPLRDHAGVLFGGAVVFRDVTEQRREFERMHLLSAVAQQTADAVVITDRNGLIEYVNPAAEKMTGFAASDLVGNTPRTLKSGLHSQGDYAKMWETLIKGDVFRGTLINRRKQSGEIYYSEQTITPIRDAAGQVSRFVSVAKDLTDVRRSLALSQRLALARDVQQRMYPAAPHIACGFDVAGLAISADETGGDYYDFLKLPGGRLGLAVGDVSGHGFDAALHMVQLRTILRTVARSDGAPDLLLARMNRLIIEELADNRFVTLVIACLDPRSRTLCYASAGHATGYLVSAGGHLKAEIRSTGMPLGLFPDAAFTSVTAPPLETGDVLALVTDGVAESSDRDAYFGAEGVIEVLARRRAERAHDIVECLCSAAKGFDPGVQKDDITVVVCKVAAQPDVNCARNA